MASIINATTSTGLVSSADNSGSLQLATNNGTTAVTVTTGQLVGIGTTSPSAKLDINGGGSTAKINTLDTFDGGASLSTWMKVGRRAGTGNNSYINTSHNGSDAVDALTFAFGTSGTGTEAMRITSGGNVTINSGYVGFTTQNGVATPSSNGQGSVGTYNVYGTTITGQGSSYDISFFNKNQAVAGYVATGATTITTSSDERLKENLQPITNALDTVNNLRTVTGNYKADPSRNVAFFIAQDMEQHFPQAFEGANPDAYGINYNWTNPLLAAAIKELKAIVDAQAVRIAELEGAK
jgi:hypothetical protein